MIGDQQEELAFAYRYPFSKEAKALVARIDTGKLDLNLVAMGKSRLEEALSTGRLGYKETGYAITAFVESYAYSRLLVSAMHNRSHIARYAEAEAYRSCKALDADTDDNLLRIATELGTPIERYGREFSMGVFQFLSHPTGGSLALVNQRLVGGRVILERHRTAWTLKGAIASAVMAGLPIDDAYIPREIFEFARDVHVKQQAQPARAAGGQNSGWIEKLLDNPIDDGRHRVVNLILAPYLTNIKGMDVEAATSIILAYIERCKTVNPMTRINEQYVSYQCRYAKEHGRKPMSLRRAMDELGGVIDFNTLLEKK